MLSKGASGPQEVEHKVLPFINHFYERLVSSNRPLVNEDPQPNFTSLSTRERKTLKLNVAKQQPRPKFSLSWAIISKIDGRYAEVCRSRVSFRAPSSITTDHRARIFNQANNTKKVVRDGTRVDAHAILRLGWFGVGIVLANGALRNDAYPLRVCSLVSKPWIYHTHPSPAQARLQVPLQVHDQTCYGGGWRVVEIL